MNAHSGKWQRGPAVHNCSEGGRGARAPSDATIANQASHWFMRKDAGLDPAGERELAAWRAADPRQEEAWARLAGTWAVFDRAEQTGAADVIVTRIQVRARQRRSRRACVATVAAGVALVAALLPWWRASVHAPAKTEPVAAIALEPIRKLPDGSIVELNIDADIAVRYESTVRRVRLLRGEAHFRVEKDPLRPFVVEANGVEIRAVGTAFTVHLQSAAVEVVVTQGSVTAERADVKAANPTSAAAPVVAGNRIVVSTAPDAPKPSRVEPLTETEIDERLAWRIPRLQLSGMELAPAVTLMNRHNRLQIVLGDPSVGRLRISGVFRSDNPEGFVRIVQETFNLQAERPSDYELVLLPASK